MQAMIMCPCMGQDGDYQKLPWSQVTRDTAQPKHGNMIWCRAPLLQPCAGARNTEDFTHAPSCDRLTGRKHSGTYLELLVDFLTGPVEPHAVLGHLESTHSHTSSISCLHTQRHGLSPPSRQRHHIKDTLTTKPGSGIPPWGPQCQSQPGPY